VRALWVKVGGLWPLSSGGRLRSFHILRELSRRHRLTVLTTHGRADDPVGLTRALPGCEVLSFPHSAPKHGSAGFAAALCRSWLSELPVDLLRWRIPALRAEVARRLREDSPDVCVVDFLAAVPSVPREGGAPRLLFEHNVEHELWRRLARAERRPWRRALLEIEWRKLGRFEARACRGSRLTLTVSLRDREALLALAPQARVEAIPTGVDSEYFHPNGTPQAAAELVFTGSLDWYPNEDAVLYFLQRILPRVRAELPATTFTAVGRNPSARLRAAALRAGARVTGTVDDVRPFVDAAALCVVPLRVGGGTRLKILEALAMGKAVVSTAVGAEGLELVPDEHFVRADGEEAFAAGVVSLLRDRTRRSALGASGRRLVQQQHSWERVAAKFEAHLAEAVACA
jgi:glycosyltransferase involved in cell wall biosynthesis